MNILYVGELESHARSYQRFRVLQELGHSVVGISQVPAGHRPVDGGNLLPRIFSKLGFPLDRANVNAGMLAAASRAAFDIVWVEKGLMLRPATLRRIRALQPHAVLASYSEDDMYARHNQSAYYRGALPLYDIVFTTKSYNSRPEELPALGARRVVFVDKAYDRATHRPLDVTPEQAKAFGAVVGFIGSFESERAAKLLTLANAGFPVRVWGNGWRGWTGKHSLLRVEDRSLFDDDYVAAICATKVNLCFLRKANRDLQTDRSMEIPACGGFMLAERTPDHLRLFEEGSEAAFFDIISDAELVQKTAYYLAHDTERREVALAGRRRCISDGYSHHDRLKQMLAECSSHAKSAR